MATTKIWPIHDNLKRVLDYAANPEKTEYDDLRQTLHYAAKREKTIGRDERTCFITGIGCKLETAYEQMNAVKERFGKNSGNLCYHAYQSFKPGEVTPEQGQGIWGFLECGAKVFQSDSYRHASSEHDG